MKEYNFFEEFKEMQKKFDKMFDTFFEDRFFNQPLLGTDNKTKELTTINSRTPRIDFKEDKNQYNLNIELPGINKKDIKLNLTEEAIEIKAENKIEKTTKNSKEYQQTSFYRKMSLPKNTNVSKAKAKYENGVLKIEIPKEKQLETKQTQLKIE